MMREIWYAILAAIGISGSDSTNVLVEELHDRIDQVIEDQNTEKRQIEDAKRKADRIEFTIRAMQAQISASTARRDAAKREGTNGNTTHY